MAATKTIEAVKTEYQKREEAASGNLSIIVHLLHLRHPVEEFQDYASASVYRRC